MFSVLEKKEILSFVTGEMNLEDIMLSEISQVEEEKYCMISLYVESKKTELRNREQIGGCQGQGGEGLLGEMVEGGQRVQTSSFNMNKFSGCNVQNGDYS